MITYGEHHETIGLTVPQHDLTLDALSMPAAHPVEGGDVIDALYDRFYAARDEWGTDYLQRLAKRGISTNIYDDQANPATNNGVLARNIVTELRASNSFAERSKAQTELIPIQHMKVDEYRLLADALYLSTQAQTVGLTRGKGTHLRLVAEQTPVGAALTRHPELLAPMTPNSALSERRRTTALYMVHTLHRHARDIVIATAND